MTCFLQLILCFLFFQQICSAQLLENGEILPVRSASSNSSCGSSSHFVMSSTQTANSILAIATMLLGISLLFEWVKHLIEYFTPLEMRVVVEHFWSELSVLGFLSFSFFILSQASVVAKVSKHLFQEDKILKEIFEQVHMFFFICMITFLLEVLGLLFLARYYFNKWRYLESLVVEEQETVIHGWWNAQDVMEQRGQLRTLFFRWFPFFEPYYNEIQAMQYLLIREHFVNPPAGDSLPKDFRFCDYMTLNLSEKLATIVDIHPITWFCLEIAFVIVWAAQLLWSTETLIQLYSLVGWTFLTVCFIFDKKVEWIRMKLLPTIPEGHPWAAAELELLQDDGLSSLHKPKLISLIGRTKSSQTSLFWFGEKGEDFLTKALSFMVLLGSVHSSIFIYGVDTEVVHSETPFGVVLFIFVSTLPMAFTAFIFVPNLINKLVLVSSIGTMKKKHYILKVLHFRKQKKAAKMVRVLRLLKKKTDELRKAERKTKALSPERQNCIREAYRTLAPNPTGGVEYRTTMKILAGIGINKNEHLFKLLSKLDQEALTYEEFEEEISGLFDEHESLDQMIARLFNVMTQGKQETIEAQQVIDLLRTVEDQEHFMPPTVEELNEFFDQVDSDHDGRITQAEFTALVNKISGFY